MATVTSAALFLSDALCSKICRETLVGTKTFSQPETTKTQNHTDETGVGRAAFLRQNDSPQLIENDSQSSRDWLISDT